MFATRIVPSALAVRLRAVCPFDTRQTVDKSTMGRCQDASFTGHSTASQLPEPIFPLNLIKIILPLRMMIQLESWYRVTENYAAPMMSRSHALCRLFNNDRSGFK